MVALFRSSERSKYGFFGLGFLMNAPHAIPSSRRYCVQHNMGLKDFFWNFPPQILGRNDSLKMMGFIMKIRHVF